MLAPARSAAPTLAEPRPTRTLAKADRTSSYRDPRIDLIYCARALTTNRALALDREICGYAEHDRLTTS